LEPAGVEITRLGAERIPELEPVFLALHEHHGEVSPTLGGREQRSPDEAWAFRRRRYETWLAEGGALWGAERERAIVGYASVQLASGYAGWRTGDRIGVVETLSVLPTERGRGIGSALLDRVERELADLGVDYMLIGAVAGNEDAQRLYERRANLERVGVNFGGPVRAEPQK